MSSEDDTRPNSKKLTYGTGRLDRKKPVSESGGKIATELSDEKVASRLPSPFANLATGLLDKKKPLSESGGKFATELFDEKVASRLPSPVANLVTGLLDKKKSLSESGKKFATELFDEKVASRLPKPFTDFASQIMDKKKSLHKSGPGAAARVQEKTTVVPPQVLSGMKSFPKPASKKVPFVTVGSRLSGSVDPDYLDVANGAGQ